MKNGVARTADFAVRGSSTGTREAADCKIGGLRYPEIAPRVYLPIETRHVGV